MKNRFSRLRVLCEDRRTQIFVENLAKHFGIGARHMRFNISPSASEDASKYVLDNFVESVRQWRAARHGDEMIAFLVVIDGDNHGVLRRRNELLKRLRDSGAEPFAANDPVAIIVPTWHIETWIAWLCGHKPIHEAQRYKLDEPLGRDVARKMEAGEYSSRRAIDAWSSPSPDESTHVPSLTEARKEIAARFGF